MKLYSTRHKDYVVGLEQALFESMPPDHGLYMPLRIPRLPAEFLSRLRNYTFHQIAWTVSRALLGDAVEKRALEQILSEALNFPVPVRQITDHIHVLELFHGPSLAFKDFGARFMSRLMQYFLDKDRGELHILVATSGDTGGAVALGFNNVPGIRVTILYPSGRVSDLQERQMTTLGDNIQALKVAGSFDDCQRMVKQAFLDHALNQRVRLSSANSINIARLIPQTFYYFNAWATLGLREGPWYVSVPSGNFGNLMAGLLARRMGLPVTRFIASTNANDEVPQYLATGEFEPRASLHTLSSAMDVGNPSNFERILDLFGGDIQAIRQQVAGYAFTDIQTLEAIRELDTNYHYIACPHTAVAWLGLNNFLSANHPEKFSGLFLATAHPCKFPEVYDSAIADRIEIPGQVQNLLLLPKRSVSIPADYRRLREILLDTSAA